MTVNCDAAYQPAICDGCGRKDNVHIISGEQTLRHLAFCGGCMYTLLQEIEKEVKMRSLTPTYIWCRNQNDECWVL